MVSSAPPVPVPFNLPYTAWCMVLSRSVLTVFHSHPPRGRPRVSLPKRNNTWRRTTMEAVEAKENRIFMNIVTILTLTEDFVRVSSCQNHTCSQGSALSILLLGLAALWCTCHSITSDVTKRKNEQFHRCYSYIAFSYTCVTKWKTH